MKWRTLSVLVVVLLMGRAVYADDDPVLPFTLSGDGLTVIVSSYDEDQGTVTGTIQRDGKQYPFTGAMESDGGAERVRGSFRVGSESFSFETSQSAGSEEVLFTTGTRTYRLRPAGKPAVAAPADSGPAARPAQDAAARLDEPLKRVTFRDMNMGGVISHHMLIPVAWQHEGHIEWSQDTYFPQTKLKVTGPDGSKITLMPAMNFSYTEAKPVPGFPPMPPQGTPPPQSLGHWVVSVIQQNSPAVSNAQLISDDRDHAAEAVQNAANQRMRANAQGEQIQVHRITYTYDMQGTRYREQWLLNYVLMPPLENQNIRSVTWSLYPVVMLTAPDAEFDALRPKLVAIYSTFRQVPKWWVQMMEVRSEIIAQRHRDNMEAIRRRGQMYDQMSEAQFRLYKEKTAGSVGGLHSDAAQDQRIQGIYEVQDYRDRDGSLVELSIHPKHVFSDGQGNLILTNRYGDKPGTNWEEIQPAR